jgi:negative regulator of flagellin synthesis FlgM
MKIWGEIPKILGVYDKTKSVARVDKSGPISAKKDDISISGSGKDFQAVMRAVRETPDIRQDLVNSLSEKYESGSYDVDSKSIAGNIVSKLFEKKV